MIGRYGQKLGVGAIFIRTIAFFVLFFLVAPIVIVAIISFSAGETLSFPPPGFSFHWYEKLWQMARWHDSLWVSLRVAVMAMTMSTVLALFAALALVRGRFAGKRYVYALIFSPMIVPTIITAVALYLFFVKVGGNGSTIAMALGHTVLAMPIAVMVLCSSLQSVDRRLEMAAYSLGASTLTTFRHVTLPLIRPAVLTAALFAFLTSFDELLIPLFLAGVGTETLSVQIWNSLLLEVDPVIAAVSTLFVALTCIALLIARLARRQHQSWR